MKKYLIIIFTVLSFVALYPIINKLLINIKFQIPTNNNSQEFSISSEEVIGIKDMLRKGLIEGRENFSIKRTIKSEEIFKLIFEVDRDEPEIMYFSGAEYKNGKLKINYSQSKSKLKKNQVAVRLKRDEIIAEIMNNSMSDYEKIKAAHDYIIDNSKYDCNIYDDYEYKDESYTAYGNLVLGVGVCEGYAKSLKYLLDKVGIENLIVIGSTKDHKHAWNLVMIDGEYYHIDLTWDDPITGGCQGVIHYTYFCLSDEEIAKTHFWNRNKYPEANGEAYNYFTYNDLIVSNKDEFLDKIRTTMYSRHTRLLLKYENYKKDNISLDTIIKEIEQKDNINILESFDYCIDECQEVFNMYFKYYDRQSYLFN